METKEQRFSRIVEEQGFDSFEGKSDIKTWIYRVSLNFCLNYDKKQKRDGERKRVGVSISSNIKL